MQEQANGIRFGCAYIRVSTEDQAELSPDSQLAEIRKYAQRENIVLLNDQIYIDPGVSGKKAERRPEFMRMISTAKSPDCPFSVILLWKYSRFARNQEESIFYKSILRSKCGVEVVSVTEPLIAGPFGSLIERIIEWMDEFYSIRLSQEVKRSMTVNAEHGKLQSTPSFGYRAKDGKLIPKEDEAQYVRWMFDSVASGKALYSIARELNDMGVRTRRGNRFENRTVEYIIRNPVYTGKLRWNPAGRTRRDYFNKDIIVAFAGHEPLVSQQTWDAAQAQLNAIKAQWKYKARPAAEYKTWLSGLVRCSSCGATLIFSYPHYYKCNNYARGRCKTSQHISVAPLEQTILSKLVQDASCFTPAFKITYSFSKGGQEIAGLEASLHLFNQKRARLQDAYLAGVLELADFAAVKRGIDHDIIRTQKALDAAQSKFDSKDTVRILQETISRAVQTIKPSDATTEEKSRSAKSIIENCVFDKASSTVSITYRLTL